MVLFYMEGLMMIKISLVVDNSVKKNVEKYINEHLPEYELIAVGHENDSIYRVIARLKEKERKLFSHHFTVWTYWNESTQSLNWGHYLLTENQAMNIFLNETVPIPSDRLSEIATLAIDGLIQDDEDSAYEYFRDAIELTEEEAKYFGIDKMNE